MAPSESRAWYKHVHLMPWVVESLPHELKKRLSEKTQAPCLPEDEKRFRELAVELNLNPRAKLPPTSPEHCVKSTRVTPLEILAGGFADDPDFGIDRDLEDSQDPAGDRQWMGGHAGPSSQGFRHQYWGGWKWSKPFATFQIPSRPMGQARERAEVMSKKARQMIQAGDLVWGTRVLAWALHYFQDLSQPFHAVEVPTIFMVPWSAWFGWPIDQGTKRLVDAMNHSITNYHWAYEGYVLNRLEKGRSGPFVNCLLNPKESVPFGVGPDASPFELADAMARVSVQLGPRVGNGNLRLFGSHLKSYDTSLPKNKNSPNYNEIAVNPQLSEERRRLEEVTCEALSNASWVSHRLIAWAFAR